MQWEEYKNIRKDLKLATYLKSKPKHIFFLENFTFDINFKACVIALKKRSSNKPPILRSCYYFDMKSFEL